MDEQIDDTALLQLLKQSDRTAFDTIYKRYWEKLYAIAYSRTRHMQAAEDIVQEVFINLWQIRQRTEIAALQSYLSMAVLYGTLRYLSLQRRRKLDSLEEGHHLAVHVNAEHILENKNMQQLLRDETNRLPEQCQLIFRYSREQEMTIRQIADKLNLSPNTVNNQLTKALGRLRKTVRTASGLFFLLTFTFF